MKARRRNSRYRAAGFTLLEAVVVMALMGIILMALATISAQWMPNWDRGLARVQRDDGLALGLERLGGDLAAAEFISVGRQTQKPFFVGTSHSVTFIRTDLSPNAHPGLEIVRLAEKNGSELVRTQAPFVPLTVGVNNLDPPRFRDPVPLVEGPYRVSFSYAGADRLWQDTWQQQTLLPRAIRVMVHDAATGRALVTSTAVLLHVEMPADCIRAKSVADCFDSRRSLAQSPDGSKSQDLSTGRSP